MKPLSVVFFASDIQRERSLGHAFIDGLSAQRIDGKPWSAGYVAPANSGVVYGIDVAVMVGVKSIELYRACRAAGIHTIMLDKGYVRHDEAGKPQPSGVLGGVWSHTRAAVDAHHPTKAMMRRNYPRDRAKKLGLELTPWRSGGDYILLAGSSAKYHRFYDLPEPTEWARNVVAELRRYTDRPIHYRPKKSWRDSVEIEGTVWARSKEPIKDALNNAWALVTHGSNACFEAALYGVPSIILGDGVSMPISSTDLSEVENPRLADIKERRQWLANLMYQQWTMNEYQSGEAWAVIKEQIRSKT